MSVPDTEREEIELSIVMPCLDEAETLATCIEKAQRSIELLGIRGEVVIADNGSTDGSQEIARNLGARVIEISQRGYGAALGGGIAAAHGTYVIMGDADDSYDFLGLDPFVEKLREGHDLVVGNRFQGGIAPGAMPPLHRYLGNPVLTAIGRLFFHSPVGDFHCGLRGFKREAILGLGLQTTGMEFASEMVVKATHNRLRITEVPTPLSPDGRSRTPHLRSWRDGWRHLRLLLLFSPRWLFLYPGALLMLAGALVGGAILTGNATLGRVTFNVNTLVYAAGAISIGFESILVAMFAKTYGINSGLLPPDPRMNRLWRVITLETGIAIGALMVLVGLAGAVYALSGWGARSFGDLDPQRTLRLVVPSALALTLGFRIVLSSFFLSVLGLGHEPE
jgi:glycosyltransferase involved in cell wall biosynthesis